MLKREFEALANRTVTDEQYKMIENLYMESSFEKGEFVKSIKGLLESIPVKYEGRPVVTVAVWDNCGSLKTPNGSYYNTIKCWLVDTDIEKGRLIMKKIPNSFNFEYAFDFVDGLKIEYI